MNLQSLYVIEHCEGSKTIIEPATAKTHRMQKTVPCGKSFNTHSETGTCPHCGFPFTVLHPTAHPEINWNGGPVADSTPI